MYVAVLLQCILVDSCALLIGLNEDFYRFPLEMRWRHRKEYRSALAHKGPGETSEGAGRARAN